MSPTLFRWFADYEFTGDHGLHTAERYSDLSVFLAVLEKVRKFDSVPK